MVLEKEEIYNFNRYTTTKKEMYGIIQLLNVDEIVRTESIKLVHKIK